MDTNLKKTPKLKNLIIALIVLVPALILISLYPKMEKAMLDKKNQWISDWEKQKEAYEEEQASKLETSIDEVPEVEYYLKDYFVNYAIEASYYQHAVLMQQATGEESYINVLDEYGWINDYFQLIEKTPYCVKYSFQNMEGEEKNLIMSEPPAYSTQEELEKLLSSEELDEKLMSQMMEDGYLGYLYLNYDSYGKLVDIRLNLNDHVTSNAMLYERAKASIKQYQNNAEYYVPEVETDANWVQKALNIQPKNFQAIYLIYDDNMTFVTSEEGMDTKMDFDNPFLYEPYYAPQDIYLETGAYVIVAILAVFVFLAAMILPCFKKLETGWEKLFSIPTEIALCLAAVGLELAFGMCMVMSFTTVTEITAYIVDQENSIELLGYQFSVKDCYNILLVVNFFGWALAFFLEYICAAQLRQFFSRPKYYLRNRLLIVRFSCWGHKKIVKLVDYVMDIEIHEKLNQSIAKLVLANGVIAALLCCLRFAGVFGIIIYSVALYIFLKKRGSKLQKQYESILNATGQMAEGDLLITMEEDLGMFAPLGEKLEGVQQGFAKAVAEETKSQNMKTELITNVSHDLKTPLTAIITYVDLLKKEDITEEERKAYIETLDLKSQRLKVLIEDLFEVSKANSGNVQMNFMDVDIVQLIKEVRVEMSDKMEQSNLDFRWNLPEEKVFLKLDGQRTYRIFENLLNNAIKYSMPLSRVYIEMEDLESEVMISVKNISAEELKMNVDYLAERFVRGDSARNSEGSGLGLAIAKSFTELQHGHFEIVVDGDLFKVCIRFLKSPKK